MISPSAPIFASIQSELMTFDAMSKTPGCYALTMPFVSTLSSYFVNRTQANDTFNSHSQNSTSITKVSDYAMDLALFDYEPQIEEYFQSYGIYQMGVRWMKFVNFAMESSHEYKNCWMRKMFGAIGSYFGVSFKKDMSIAKCELQQSVPECWAEFKKSMENEPDVFPYENMTVDSIFFDVDEAHISVGGDYNLTNVLDYNITDSLDNVQVTAYHMKDVAYEWLSSGYSYAQEKMKRSGYIDDIVIPDNTHNYRSTLGVFFDSYSPTLETVNKLQSYRKEARQYSSQNVDEEVTNHELESACHTIDSSNAQKCWQMWVADTFSAIDKEYINSNLASLDLYLISFLPQFHITLSIFFSIVVAMLFGFRDPMEQALPCFYDIIVSEDLKFDSEGIQNSTSFLRAHVEPLGREQFSTLPIRLVDSIVTIVQHEQFQPAFANVTEAAVEKLR